MEHFERLIGAEAFGRKQSCQSESEPRRTDCAVGAKAERHRLFDTLRRKMGGEDFRAQESNTWRRVASHGTACSRDLLFGCGRDRRWLCHRSRLRGRLPFRCHGGRGSGGGRWFEKSLQPLGNCAGNLVIAGHVALRRSGSWFVAKARSACGFIAVLYCHRRILRRPVVIVRLLGLLGRRLRHR